MAIELDRSTVTVPYRKGPGRPKRDPLAVVRGELEKNRDEYLLAFWEIKMKALGVTVPMGCQEECPYGDSCKVEGPEVSKCTFEEKLFTSSVQGHMAELGVEV